MAMRKVWWQYLCMFLLALVGSASFTILTYVKPDQTDAIQEILNVLMKPRDAEASFSRPMQKYSLIAH